MFYSEHDIASDRINSQLQQTPNSKSPTTIPTNKDKLNRKQTAGGPAGRACAPAIWLPQTQCAPCITVEYQPIGPYEYKRSKNKIPALTPRWYKTYCTSAVEHESGSDRNTDIVAYRTKLSSRTWMIYLGCRLRGLQQHTHCHHHLQYYSIVYFKQRVVFWIMSCYE